MNFSSYFKKGVSLTKNIWLYSGYSGYKPSSNNTIQINFEFELDLFALYCLPTACSRNIQNIIIYFWSSRHLFIKYKEKVMVYCLLFVVTTHSYLVNSSVSEECVYEGRTRDHGTTWPRDPLRPCVTLTCVNGQVTSEDRSSDCPPPPADHCAPRQVNYQCCPEYDCVTGDTPTSL